VPVTIRQPPADLSFGGLTLVDVRARRVAAEPIVEWLDRDATRIVPAPAGVTDPARVLLVYFVPRGFDAGGLEYAGASLGPVRRGGTGPARPRSSCKVLGAFRYAPIPQRVLLELEVERALAAWTPFATTMRSSAELPTRCSGYRRLDPRSGTLWPLGTHPPDDATFVPRARFLALYDLPDDATPAALRWDGTDCEESALPARDPLPERLGPDRGPPPMEEFQF
jgi:hypothetical protein